MRYLAIAASLVILAAACGGDAGQPSATGDNELARMTLQDEDVPPEIAVLSEVQVVPGEGNQCLTPGGPTAPSTSTLVFRTFDAPEPFPAMGAQRVIVTSTLHASRERAQGELDCAAAAISSSDTDRLLQPEWHLISYEGMDSLDVGEDRKVIHYVAVNAEGLVSWRPIGPTSAATI